MRSILLLLYLSLHCYTFFYFHLEAGDKGKTLGDVNNAVSIVSTITADENHTCKEIDATTSLDIFEDFSNLSNQLPG